MRKTIAGEGIVTEITEKFNPAIEFTEKDMVSMLFYLGYLTIEENEFDYPKLNIPNKVMKEICKTNILLHRIVNTKTRARKIL